MAKPESVKGLSLTIDKKEVIVIGNVKISFYKSDTGHQRIKIDAPKEIPITRISMEQYIDDLNKF